MSMKPPRKAPIKAPELPFPNNYSQDYYRNIRDLVETNRKKLWNTYKNRINPLVKEYRRMSRDHSIKYDDPLDEISRELENLRNQSEKQIFNTPRLENMARNFILGVSAMNKDGVRKQIKSVTGIDPLFNDKWLDSFVKTAIKDNVNWIKSIEKEYFDRIETIIYQGVREGQSLNTMAKNITNTANKSKNRAKFIARDQAGSLYGDMTKRRHQSVGIQKFVWVTSLDERVRGNPAGKTPWAIPNHWELHNKIFTWSKGVEKYNGLLPGKDYNCRCTAKPLIEDPDLLRENM